MITTTPTQTCRDGKAKYHSRSLSEMNIGVQRLAVTLPLCDQVTHSTDAAVSTDAPDSTGATNPTDAPDSTDAADSAGPAGTEI